MYNLLISLGAGVVAFAAVSLMMSPWAAFLPGSLVFVVAMFLLARRTTGQVQGELTHLMALLQKQKVEAAKAKIKEISDRYGKWQFLLRGQMSAQLGMLDYVQMKWDTALPLLEEGRFRNWGAEVCIGAIHYRRGRKDKAWDSLEKAVGIAKKEAIIYLVWATLLARDGKRDKALEVLNRGLQVLPESGILSNLRGTVANKRKIKVKSFPEQWFQFFPEDLVKRMAGRGQAGVGPGGRMAPPQPRARGKMARRR